MVDFVISYPETGVPQHNAVSGIWRIDFYEGLVVDPNGTQTTLNRNLGRSNREYIRSLWIHSSNELRVHIGDGETNTRPFVPANTPVKIEDVEIRNFAIELIESQTPDEHSLLIVASTEKKVPYEWLSKLFYHHSDVPATATTNSYATVYEKYVPCFVHNTFVVEETGTTNGLTYKIDTRMDSDENYVELQGDTTVAASGTDVIQIEGCFGWLRVQVKSTVTDSAAEFTGQWRGFG